MRILAEATSGISNALAQPQDLAEEDKDYDFFGQVERLTEQFVIDVRRVAIQ